MTTGEITQIEEAFPEEIELILCDDSDQEDINKEYKESILFE